MPIETRFSFNHGVALPFAPAITATPDLLGPLRGLVGAGEKRRWVGKGFTMLWRPNHGQSGPTDFFLQLILTNEVLEFTDITGTGIANRGLLQDDIALGGLLYLQTIFDSFDGSGQHAEPGVWANVPATTVPSEQATVVRMGSIPHGTTINMQGTALETGSPQFHPVSITPFRIGDPNSLVHFDAEDLSKPSLSRTMLAQVVGLDQAHLNNPNRFLVDATANQVFVRTTAISVSSHPTVPDAGGGTGNIAFLVKPPPNSEAAHVTATFWIERVKGSSEYEADFDQIQYTQTVLLDFAGLSWPHISVATLRAEPASGSSQPQGLMARMARFFRGYGYAKE